jgi:hypothetical protein
MNEEIIFVQPNRDQVVALDPISAVPEPGYAVYGKTQCFVCNGWCWLGEDTMKVVQAGTATPLCLPCATAAFAKMKTDPVFLGNAGDL